MPVPSGHAAYALASELHVQYHCSAIDAGAALADHVATQSLQGRLQCEGVATDGNAEVDIRVIPACHPGICATLHYMCMVGAIVTFTDEGKLTQISGVFVLGSVRRYVVGFPKAQCG